MRRVSRLNFIAPLVRAASAARGLVCQIISFAASIISAGSDKRGIAFACRSARRRPTHTHTRAPSRRVYTQSRYAKPRLLSGVIGVNGCSTLRAVTPTFCKVNYRRMKLPPSLPLARSSSIYPSTYLSSSLPLMYTHISLAGCVRLRSYLSQTRHSRCYFAVRAHSHPPTPAVAIEFPGDRPRGSARDGTRDKHALVKKIHMRAR